MLVDDACVTRSDGNEGDCFFVLLVHGDWMSRLYWLSFLSPV